MELDSRKEKAEVPQKCVWVGGCASVALEGRRKDIEAEEAIIDRRKKHQSTPSQHQVSTMVFENREENIPSLLLSWTEITSSVFYTGRH